MAVGSWITNGCFQLLVGSSEQDSWASSLNEIEIVNEKLKCCKLQVLV
jgi:hypothetical protein